MGELILSDHHGHLIRPEKAIRLRDIIDVGVRHSRLITISFFGILLGALLLVFLQPNRYEAGMKILVKRGRVDPIVSAEAAAMPQLTSETTEEQINSEVELLKSRDLLEGVVLACNLQHPPPTFLSQILGHFDKPEANPAEQEKRKVARAVNKLAKDLKVDVIRKTNLIAVKYESQDPELAARVLNTLANLYLDKHVAVHRPYGAVEFFRQEVTRYQKELADAEARLIEFTRGTAVVSAPVEKDGALQKLAEFKASLRQTEAAIGETQVRVRALKEQSSSTPSRLTSQVRSTDDGKLLSDLRTNLLALQQKRTELTDKFEPTYRPVQQIDAQIEQTRAAIASAEKFRLHEETTDRNPTYDWVKQELARADAELAGLKARAESTASSVRYYQESALTLEQKEVVQNDLFRVAKSAEANYLLYKHKEEEARIAEALDGRRILNVTVAEAASIPALPSTRRSEGVFFGVLFAAMLSGALALAAEYMDSTFRTPSEVEACLDIPVLAAPSYDANSGTGIYEIEPGTQSTLG